MIHELTKEEKSAIKALKKVALIWPKTLWLFSASGDIHVMRCGENGEHVMTGTPGMRDSGVDPSYVVDSIHGIDNDGGDF